MLLLVGGGVCLLLDWSNHSWWHYLPLKIIDFNNNHPLLLVSFTSTLEIQPIIKGSLNKGPHGQAQGPDLLLDKVNFPSTRSAKKCSAINITKKATGSLGRPAGFNSNIEFARGNSQEMGIHYPGLTRRGQNTAASRRDIWHLVKLVTCYLWSEINVALLCLDYYLFTDSIWSDRTYI